MDLEREAEEQSIQFTKENVGDIRFENISFSYGTRQEIFKDFSFVIPIGKLTAIIGESGSGKTTLSALIQKLYPLNSGKITINDQNINYFDNESLRKIVSSVPQQLSLFNGGIIDNIAVGECNPDMNRILFVIKKLGLISFIEKLPQGLHTNIGENGISLSGGEKQRLAIARAIYRNPEILILDEATSSLDAESENYVKQVINDLKKEGKTILIISHRLNTVVNADKIAILKNGCLVEEGTHEMLYKKGSRYYDMWLKQLPKTL